MSENGKSVRKERSDIRIANIVPNEFKALWDAHEDEEDFKINVPDPYPTIDWSKVNKRFISNIPEPTRLASVGWCTSRAGAAPSSFRLSS